MTRPAKGISKAKVRDAHRVQALACQKAAAVILSASQVALEPDATSVDIAAFLIRSAERLMRDSRAHAEFAQQAIGPGRPVTRHELRNPLANLTKARVGRPPTRGPAFDRATYRIVEERRAELRRQRKASSIKAAIISLSEELATRTGLNRVDTIKYELNRLRASYRSGKILSST